jgi:hypothetical protein
MQDDGVPILIKIGFVSLFITLVIILLLAIFAVFFSGAP